jgi:gas vesicle protein
MRISDWVLDAVPYKRKSAADWILPAMLGVSFGLATGVCVGLLYAPETGEEARLRLREGASRMKDRAQRLADRAKGQLAAKSEQIQSELARS